MAPVIPSIIQTNGEVEKSQSVSADYAGESEFWSNRYEANHHGSGATIFTMEFHENYQRFKSRAPLPTALLDVLRTLTADSVTLPSPADSTDIAAALENVTEKFIDFTHHFFEFVNCITYNTLPVPEWLPRRKNGDSSRRTPSFVFAQDCMTLARKVGILVPSENHESWNRESPLRQSVVNETTELHLRTGEKLEVWQRDALRLCEEYKSLGTIELTKSLFVYSIGMHPCLKFPSMNEVQVWIERELDANAPVAPKSVILPAASAPSLTNVKLARCERCYFGPYHSLLFVKTIY